MGDSIQIIIISKSCRFQMFANWFSFCKKRVQEDSPQVLTPAVFRTDDLLQSVLCFVDPYQCVKLQRVSRCFKRVTPQVLGQYAISFAGRPLPYKSVVEYLKTRPVRPCDFRLEIHFKDRPELKTVVDFSPHLDLFTHLYYPPSLVQIAEFIQNSASKKAKAKWGDVHFTLLFTYRGKTRFRILPATVESLSEGGESWAVHALLPLKMFGPRFVVVKKLPNETKFSFFVSLTPTGTGPNGNDHRVKGHQVLLLFKTLFDKKNANKRSALML